jgi:hypothetical protein
MNERTCLGARGIVEEIKGYRMIENCFMYRDISKVETLRRFLSVVEEISCDDVRR